jgi:hypothetical protein
MPYFSQRSSFSSFSGLSSSSFLLLSGVSFAVASFSPSLSSSDLRFRGKDSRVQMNVAAAADEYVT